MSELLIVNLTLKTWFHSAMTNSEQSVPIIFHYFDPNIPLLPLHDVAGPFGMVLAQTPGMEIQFKGGATVRTIVKSVRPGSHAEERGISYGMWLYKINDWKVSTHKLSEVHAQLKVCVYACV